MGSWGNGPLQNDEAVDWLCQLDRFLIETIKGNGPRGSKGEIAIDERIAAIYAVSLLNLEPNFKLSQFKTCPLGYKFPNLRTTEVVLECIKKMKESSELFESQEELLNKYQDHFEKTRNKLLAEHL